MPASASPLLVAAFGNDMAGDDAFGPAVARALHTMALCGVEVVDLGMTPAALLDYLADRTAVCIVDAAIDERLAPGTLVEADFFDPNRPQLVRDRALSSHGLSVASQLALASRLGPLPDEVRIVAVTLGSAELGRPVSKEVVRQVPVAARRIAEWAMRGRGDAGEPLRLADQTKAALRT